jgi:hypothetical protein
VAGQAERRSNQQTTPAGDEHRTGQERAHPSTRTTPSLCGQTVNAQSREVAGQCGQQCRHDEPGEDRHDEHHQR